jgi:hypothetical protein
LAASFLSGVYLAAAIIWIIWEHSLVQDY